MNFERGVVRHKAPPKGDDDVLERPSIRRTTPEELPLAAIEWWEHFWLDSKDQEDVA